MKHKCKLAAAFVASAFLAGSAFAADVSVARVISANTTWTQDNTYFLEGYTFVANNATLTIEPGTVIKGRQSTGANAAALIITRGAKIMAEGTASQPIIFTSELDDLNGSLDHNDTGLWGGVILLGNAQINSRSDGEPAGTPAQDQVEGLSVTGDEVAYATFGGTDDTDNSGVLKYVSIRHGGAPLSADDEINGLTLGGVGSGTTIDYVEIFANKDDDLEFFGGTVNVSHLVCAFGNDDGPDIDQGYRGRIQFLFKIQTEIDADQGDKAVEWDGATSPLNATPVSDATIANATFIGIGSSGAANTALNIRDNATAKVYNSIFVNYAKMLLIESDVGNVAPDLKGNLWWSHVAANNTAAGLVADGSISYSADYWTNAVNNNLIINPGLTSISYEADGMLNPLPGAGSPALTGTVETLAQGFVQTDYKGAFKDTNWAAGWTKLWTGGYFAESSAEPESDTKFVNISTRGFVGTGSQILVAGFVVQGESAQSLLIRGVGPTLGTFPGVTGVLADPEITVFKIEGQTNTVVATNDNWSGADVAAAAAKVGAFALPASSADAALLVELEPGIYTVEVKGKNNTTGVAIVEVYEND